MSTCTALIVAAGRGSRFGGPLPKQYAFWPAGRSCGTRVDAYRCGAGNQPACGS